MAHEYHSKRKLWSFVTFKSTKTVIISEFEKMEEIFDLELRINVAISALEEEKNEKKKVNLMKKINNLKKEIFALKIKNHQ